MRIDMVPVSQFIFSRSLLLLLRNVVVVRNRKMACGAIVAVISVSNVTAAQNIQYINNDTLAIIGTKIITTQQFARLYKDKLVKRGLSDNGETREGYLRNLVDDEILIARAKSRKLDRTKDALAELARIQVQELLNAYSVKHISPTIEVTESDLKELFVKMNTKIKVRHLYSRTKEEAQSLYDEILRGKSFDELAAKCFTDPQLKENGGSLGYISVDEMDPDFEKAAYSMRVGEISKPVKTVEGYSILRVDDLRQNPLLTENEFLKARERLKAFERKRKYEDAVKLHTIALRNELKIQFNAPLLSRLYAITREQSLEYVMENKSRAIVESDLKKTVVSSTNGNWTVDDVIKALSTTKEKQRKWIRTEENFEDIIAGLMMRRYISESAKREKLDAGPSFHENVEYAFDTYLLTTTEEGLKKKITFSSDSLKSYYVNNRDRFRTQAEIRLSGILVDNATLADSVRASLERGAPFDEQARQFSIQHQTAQQGGDLGLYRKDDLGELGGELFAMGVGEWKGPIVDDGKYLFVKCTGRKESTYRSFEESSKEIEQLLVSLAWYDARSKYVDVFKKKIDCRVYPERIMALSL